MSYRIGTFGSAPFEIIDGDRGKAYPKQNELRPSGHCLFLSATNVTKTGFDFGSGQFIDEQKDVQLRKGKLQREDLVLTTRGTLGNVAYYNNHVPFEHVRINSGMVILRCDQSKILPRYLYAYLRSVVFQRQVERYRSGVAQPQLPIRDMKWIEIPLPTPLQQKHIVEFVSAYDDLIENNWRRISLLEEAARLLYREWFVHFRFPGHEHVKIIDGLPERWVHSVPRRIITNHIGGGWGKDAPKGKEGEPAFVIRGTDIPRVESGDIGSVGLRFHSETSLSSRVLEPYDIVFEVSGGSSSQPIARTLLLTEERLKVWNTDVICASFCKRFTFSTATDALYFIYHIREHRDRGEVLVYQKESASSLKNFNFRSFMSTYQFLLPPISLRKRFFQSIDPIVRHQSVLAEEIQKLAKARDLLLPRLMNGEIAV